VINPKREIDNAWREALQMVPAPIAARAETLTALDYFRRELSNSVPTRSTAMKETWTLHHDGAAGVAPSVLERD
jgi:hypothetical protein